MALKIKAKERLLKFSKNESDPGFWRYVMVPDLYSTLDQEKVIKEAAIRSGVSEGVMQACWKGAGEVIKAWATEGHSVALPGLGNMRFGLSAKAVADVNDVKTSDLLERILASRYGVTRRVVIRSCEDAAERTAERLARYDAENRAMQEELFAENLARAEEERKAREEEERKKNLAKKTSLTGGEKAFVTRENGSCFRVGSTVFETEGAEWIFGLPVRLEAPTPMATVTDARSDLFVCGTVFSNVNRANRTGDRITYTVGFSDGTSSLLIKKSVSPDEKGP